MSNKTEQGLSLGVQISFSISAVIIIFENILTLVVILPNRYMRTYTNAFLISLAVSDFTVGCIFLPAYITNPFQDMNGYVTSIVLISNVYNIVAVTMERYISVKKPLMYQAIMTQHFLKMLVLAWFFPISISLLPLLWGSTEQEDVQKGYLVFLVTCGILVPYIFIIVAYCKIFKEVRRQVRRLESLGINAHEEKRKIRSEGKVSLVFAIIAGIFALAWAPIVFMAIYVIMEKFQLIPKELYIISVCTIVLNSMTNPVVYILLKNDFKNALKNLIKCKKSRISTQNTAELIPKQGEKLNTTIKN